MKKKKNYYFTTKEKTTDNKDKTFIKINNKKMKRDINNIKRNIKISKKENRRK